MRFRVEVLGEPVFDRAFNRIDSLSDLRPLYPPVIEEFYRIEAEQFASEGAAGGQRWQPLTRPYAARKEREFGAQPILQASGDLMASLTDPEALDAVLSLQPQELAMGTRNPTAVWHQRGTKRGLPRRPPINFSEAQKRRLQKAIQAGLVQFVREAGFRVEGGGA